MGVNGDHFSLISVPRLPSRGSPTLWSMRSNVPTNRTTKQTDCITIIIPLNTWRGSISVRYDLFLKNEILFNIIIDPEDNVRQLERECDHGRNKTDSVYKNFHNDFF